MKKFNCNSGQALVESAIGFSFVIIPLLLLLPFLSKMTGVQHRAQEASHYTAWERTVWKENQPSQLPSTRNGIFLAKKTEPELAINIPWRFYQKNGQKITSEIAENWDWNGKVHPLLKHQVVKNSTSQTVLAPSNENPDNNKAFDRFTRSSEGGKVPGSLAGLVGQAVGFLSFTGFSLERDQFYRTQITTKLENHYIAPFDKLNLEFTNKSALLASGWNAGGSLHVKNRVENLVLTKHMDISVMRTVQRLIGFLPFGKELHPNNLKLGHIEPDALPQNRLCTYGTANCGG